jgi:hypothetical protein
MNRLHVLDMYLVLFEHKRFMKEVMREKSVFLAYLQTDQ